MVTEEFFNQLENYLILDELETWQDLIFKVWRNPNYDKNLTQKEKSIKNPIYNKYIRELDNKNLISGPICEKFRVY